MLIIFVSILGRSFGPNPTTLPVFSNGTHLFHATTIVTSLDGFKAAYLDEHPDLLPNLISLGNSSLGIRAESMQPCFPTLTFPNHWSMMTGLYPESHGIVANDFWAPATEKQFVLSDRDQSWDPEWWWGEPIWSVAERAGRITANIMWPGPPVTSQGISPTYFIPYDVVEPSVKSKQIFDWLDMPIEVRPHLIFAYLPDTDQKGHLGGPGSTEEEQALSLVDGYIGQLKEGLQARNLTGIVNLIVLSDHGMTSTANERLIFVDDILGEEGYDAIEHRDGWPCVGLRFKEGTDTAPLLDQLLVAAEQSNGAFAVYTRATMPDRWHFNKTDRIAPIYVVPHLGWALTDHHEYEVIHEGDYRPRGNHGYDNIHPDMQAIFFTYGPFAHQLRQADIVGTGDLLSPEPGVLNSEPPGVRQSLIHQASPISRSTHWSWACWISRPWHLCITAQHHFGVPHSDTDHSHLETRPHLPSWRTMLYVFVGHKFMYIFNWVMSLRASPTSTRRDSDKDPEPSPFGNPPVPLS